MGRRANEVNGTNVDACHGRAALAVVVLAASLLVNGCGGEERRAERLYREASSLVEKGDHAGAVEKLERIVREYPRTTIAGKAREEVVVYRGLANAVRQFPARRSREILVQTGRAIERFRASRGAWPATLADLVPAYLTGVPDDAWGRALLYERTARGYRLTCLGGDGRAGGEGDDADIVVANGEFVTSGAR